MFVNKKQTPFENGKIVPKVPEYTEEELQIKKFKEFLNTKRCMVCGAQLDGVVYSLAVKQTCVAERHYSADFQFGFHLPTFYVATYIFANQQNKYVVESHRIKDFEYKNIISEFNPSVMGVAKKLVSYTGAIISLPPALTEIQFIAKLRMYQTFS